MSGKRPEWRRSLGLISVAIFAHENSGENGANTVTRSVHCQRRYFDKNANEWKSSGYLSPADIAPAVSLLKAAEDYLLQLDESAADSTSF